ncbi:MULTISPECIES: dihydropteroate synthase [Micrococcaceae]|uniref:dihydropteroate synthase n=1 Tax=Micrococcaceae TaxID=1268 RepID=UPI0010368CEC|nr:MULTISPECIES: dihydropteroate synthase [Micrococcaceae]TAP27692.1 dihydropteroate synthase [Arthrobacter sp. S41]UXN30628.1 dihydropteroate synthase [Glutamicibacter sp. M10]
MFKPDLLVPVHEFSRKTIDFSRQIAVMAVINRTPDSFYDAGSTFVLDQAVNAALQAVQAGADWVDIGGVPFSPGPELAWEEEAERIVPVIKAVREASDVIISADTFQPKVAQAAIEAGADVINDTTGLAYPELAQVVAKNDVHLVITHSLAKPRTIYPRPTYTDVVAEVREYLSQKVQVALDAGISPSKIIVDPGHDLNKNTAHTLELTERFEEFANLGYPALAAVSNKDFIGETLDLPKSERTLGSMVAATICAMNGARILRMHNIAESVQMVRMIEATHGWREPAYQIHNMGDVNPPAHPERSQSN